MRSAKRQMSGDTSQHNLYDVLRAAPSNSALATNSLAWKASVASSPKSRGFGYPKATTSTLEDCEAYGIRLCVAHHVNNACHSWRWSLTRSLGRSR